MPISEVEQQGHDNRSFRLGDKLLIRMPTAASYALKVPKEQELLPLLARYLTVSIPQPIEMGEPSRDFPFPFSIYKWLDGKSLNLVTLDLQDLRVLAVDLTKFLKELQQIDISFGPPPGQHNGWRGDHVSVYDQGAREQIAKLHGVIDTKKALKLWEDACKTRWEERPVWIHGDLAVGNILIKDHKLSGIIDFGGTGVGDPACDLVIAWTYFSDQAREIFISGMAMDEGTWLRARAWALWKATFHLCEEENFISTTGKVHRKIIEDVLQGY